MKRIYLLLATITVFLIAGCSNDDVVGPEPPVVDGDETILFSIGVSSSSVATKAEDYNDIKGLTGEKYINNLTVLLFKPDGSYAYGKRVVDAGDHTLNFVGDLEVAAGTYDIILIANSSIDYTDEETDRPATLVDLNTKVDNITKQSQDNLLMVSKLYEGIQLNYAADASTTSGIARRTYCYMLQEAVEGKDVLSYTESKNSSLSSVYTGSYEPVVLTRLVSRIQLESLAVNFTENLAGCSFRLDSVYLVNMRKRTSLSPSGDSYEAIPTANPLYYRGGPSEFNIIDHLIAPNDISEVLAIEGKRKGFKIFEDTEISDELNNEDKSPLFWDYGFENHNTWSANGWEDNEYEARLVISGKILYPVNEESEETVSFEQSHYHIPIAGKDFQLVRNKIYSINATITGYGSNEPDGSSGDNVALMFNITVEDWNIIKQIENDDPVQ